MEALASALERGPFSRLWLGDRTTFDDERAAFDPFVLAGAMARFTTGLRLGVVAGADRLPAPLAKQATTLDVISEGRAELALRVRSEPPDAGARAAEALRVCRSVLEDRHPAFDGRFYRVDGAVNHPRPVQRGGIPLSGVVDAADIAVGTVPDLWALVDTVVAVGEVERLTGAKELLGSVGRSGTPPPGEPVELWWCTPRWSPSPGRGRGGGRGGAEIDDLVAGARRAAAVGVDGVMVCSAEIPGPETVAALTDRLGFAPG
jgi:hypothetical protein